LFPVSSQIAERLLLTVILPSFVWVSQIKGRTRIENIQEQGAKENISTYEGENDRRLEQTAK
jgi:hypothetical protein